MSMNCLNCDSPRVRYDKNTDNYVCLECGYTYAKQYFFISHSHLDIEKVRVIRNVIEETFFYEPILFFLKCISNDTELQDLIYREISERIWFVYCKSKNAESSKYVQQERAYLQKLIESGKRINVVESELDKFEIWDKECYEYLRSQIAYQIKISKIFISYPREADSFAKQLYTEFSNRGYSIWQDTDLTAGSLWFDTIESKIKQNSYKDGVFLLLLTKNSLHSQYVLAEIHQALSNGAFIVPVSLCKDENERQELLDKIKSVCPNLLDRFLINVSQEDIPLACDKIIQAFQTKK